MSFSDTMAVITRTALYTFLSSFVVLSVLSPRSKRARMYLNVLIYISGMGVSSVWGIFCALGLAITGKRLDTNYYVARSFYLIAGTLIGIKFEVEGEENFAKARPAVLVGNHQTGIDILYLGRIFPKHASIMAKQELKYSPLLGQFMSLSGAVFINRKNRKDAIKAFDQVGDDMKRKGVSLWIFPEGTRSNLPFPDLLPFKKGAFHLAVQAQVPIVPVVCENYNRLFDGKTRFESGTIRIKVLEPIETKGLTGDDVTELTTRVRSLMLKELQAMDASNDDFDTSAVASRPSSSVVSSQGGATGASLSVASNHPSKRGRSPEGLGGIAGWMAKIVGTGKGGGVEATAKKVEQREAEFRSKAGSTSAGKPDDYGLVSEGDRKKKEEEITDAVKATGAGVADKVGEATQRRTRTSGSGSDETDDGNVIVKKPL